MKIVVAGYVAQFPVAGLFWHHVSYVLAFRDLGHEVWFLEDAGDEPWGWDLDGHRLDLECRAGVRYLEREMRDLGLQGKWVFRHLPSGRHDGLDEATTLDILAEADVLVNVSCTTQMRPEYLRVPHRLAIDTDPVYTQIRVREGPLAHVVENHTRLFTYGRPPLPAQQHEWVPTRQPVVARFWPVTSPAADAPFATIGQWRSEWAVSWNGESYQGKDATFQPYLDLPSRSTARFRVALGGRDEGLGADLLGRHGWEIADSIAASRSSAAYRAFIAASAGEFSVAKHGYVAPRSGWFSERTCCFLVSGRPAVVQDTGFSEWLPTGSGLLAFSTPDEARAAVEQVLSDPRHHAQAARALVVEHFDGARVCAELLEAAL